MHNDGLDGDDVADDEFFTVVLPASLQLHRRLIRYRITSAHTLGASITGPYADDPQPNFAYYVYGEMPAWNGAIQPGAPAPRGTPVTYTPTLLNGVPVSVIMTVTVHFRLQ